MNHLFESAFRSAPIGIALMGLDGRWLHVNRAMCGIVGYSQEELLALTFQDITHPDDLGPDLEKVGQLLRGEILQYQLEKRYFHKDGRIVWINLTATLARNEQGVPENFIAHIQDITARKTSELAQRQSQLEQSRLFAELRAAQQESQTLREGLLTICAWTKRIRHDGRWMSVDEFLSAYLHLQLTHGISEEGMQTALSELDEPQKDSTLPPTTPSAEEPN